MATYQRLNSILNKDGTNYQVDLMGWAEYELQGSELAQFRADNDEILSYVFTQIDNGNCTVTVITDEIETDGSLISVPVGVRVFLSDQYQIPAKETEWYAKMASDPNITTFNDLVLISQ